MDKEQNFLDILEQNIKILLQKGVISVEGLNEGIQFHETWLTAKRKDKNDEILNKDTVIATLVDLIIDSNENYMEKCADYGVDPEKISNIEWIEYQGKIQIEVTGNDGWSKVLITNNKNDNLGILQITPEEFVEKVYKKELNIRKWEATKKTKDDLQLWEVSKIIDDFMDDNLAQLIKTKLKDDLGQMAENLVKYYEYIAKKEQEEKDRYIEAGYRQRKVEPDETGKTKRDGYKSDRFNEVIDFRERKDLLESLNPIKKIRFKDSSSKDSENPEPSVCTFIYKTKKPEEGYIMMCEPYNGDERSRIIYLPDEVINEDSLENPQEKDDDFWKKLARSYVNMGDKEFRKEARTYALNHTNSDNYLKTIERVILGELYDDEKDNLAVKARVKKIRGRLFEGELNPDIKEQVADAVRDNVVTERSLHDTEEYLGERDNSLENTSSKTEEGKEEKT